MFNARVFDFLDELAANNERQWFEANKMHYESLVREPALQFIQAMADELPKFAPHFRADPRKTGGSLMRVYRDTRFTRIKTPYKTNIGIQFRHELGKDVHAPGFYVHIASDECLFAAGCWRPDSLVLGRIRNWIVEYPEKWFAACNDKQFTAHWHLSGDSLSRPPRGFASTHPAIEDLKRKDFIGVAPLAYDEIVSPELVKLASTRFAAAQPLMSFLCEALGLRY